MLMTRGGERPVARWGSREGRRVRQDRRAVYRGRQKGRRRRGSGGEEDRGRALGDWERTGEDRLCRPRQILGSRSLPQRALAPASPLALPFSGLRVPGPRRPCPGACPASVRLSPAPPSVSPRVPRPRSVECSSRPSAVRVQPIAAPALKHDALPRDTARRYLRCCSLYFGGIEAAMFECAGQCPLADIHLSPCRCLIFSSSFQGSLVLDLSCGLPRLLPPLSDSAIPSGLLNNSHRSRHSPHLSRPISTGIFICVTCHTYTTLTLPRTTSRVRRSLPCAPRS